MNCKLTCGADSLKLDTLEARECDRSDSDGGGSGLPQSDDAQDVDDLIDNESARLRIGDTCTCFNIVIIHFLR